MSSPAEWLFLAETDLKAALGSLDHSVPNMVCFHAQQVAEKCLKAVLESAKAEIPRTHELPFLYELVIKINPGLEEIKEELMFLNRFYVPTRYPEALPGSLEENLPTIEMAKQAVRYAEQIFSLIKEKIQ